MKSNPIFSNKTSADVILETELKRMFAKDFTSVVTREHVIGFVGKRIDRDFLVDKVKDFGQYFYVCGPDEFVKSNTELLSALGASADSIVVEQ